MALSDKQRLFEDSWKRIDRAVVHGEAFRAEWEGLINPNSYRVFIEMETDWTSGAAKAVPLVVTKNNMALELGEFFYQLRACLDALVYQVAVISECSDPPANQDSVEFPIYINPKKFDRNPINNPPFPEEMRNWLETIQPYNTAKTAGTTYSTLNKTLGLLHDCARKDRHRKLHVVAAVPIETKWDFKVSGAGKITFVNPVRANFLENESVFLVFGTEGIIRGDGTNIGLNTEIVVNISIDEIPVPSGGNIGAELTRLVQAAEFIINTFESMCV